MIILNLPFQEHGISLCIIFAYFHQRLLKFLEYRSFAFLGSFTPRNFIPFDVMVNGIFIIIIYLFLAVLDLHCCSWPFSGCGEQGLFVVVRGLLVVMAFLVAQHRL